MDQKPTVERAARHLFADELPPTQACEVPIATQPLKIRVLEQCSQYGNAAAPRQAMLAEALQITSQDRNTAYGNPEDNFANIAAYWDSYCKQRFKVSLDITGQDVAHFMILMKLARLATNAGHYDSLVDIAGYAACAADCQANPQKPLF